MELAAVGVMPESACNDYMRPIKGEDAEPSFESFGTQKAAREACQVNIVGYELLAERPATCVRASSSAPPQRLLASGPHREIAYWI